MRAKRARSAAALSASADPLWPAFSRRWLLHAGSAGLGAAVLSGNGASLLMPRPALAAAGQDVFHRVSFEDPSDLTSLNEPMTGHFRTAPADKRDVNFVWGGDVVGQGWGIDPDLGGMTIFKAMAGPALPDFLHPFRRFDLCRRTARGRNRAAARIDLEERHDRGEIQGRPDAGRISRRL